MLSTVFNSSTIPLLEQVVGFTETRHGVLAGNIANLDTPGYRTRDVSPDQFRERLKAAITARNEPQPTSPGFGGFMESPGNTSRGGRRNVDPMRNVAESMKSLLRHDDTDVGLEQQINAMMKNQSQHNMAIGIMTAQFRLLRAAITERVG